MVVVQRLPANLLRRTRGDIYYCHFQKLNITFRHSHEDGNPDPSSFVLRPEYRTPTLPEILFLGGSAETRTIRQNALQKKQMAVKIRALCVWG
jgi:hypothetical protein